MKELRECFVETISGIRRNDHRLHVLVSDSTSTCKIKPFEDEFPEAVINVGIAEQNLIGIAAGMSLGGLLPFTANAAMIFLQSALSAIFSFLLPAIPQKQYR